MQGNVDSDRSISDEELFERDWPETCNSLGGVAEKKGALQLPSRLDILRGTSELKCGVKSIISSYENKAQFPLEDEVEMPISWDAGGFIHSSRKELTLCSDKEIISDDDENNLPAKFSITSGARNFQNVDICCIGSEKPSEEHTSSAVNKEANAIGSLNEHNSSNFKLNRFSKGIRGKIKPKFSFGFHSHRGRLSQPSMSEDHRIVSSPDKDNNVLYKVHEVPVGLEAIAGEIMENQMDQIFEDFEEEKKQEFEKDEVTAEVKSHKYGNTKHSITELLDGLQDKSGVLRRNPKLHKRTKGKGKHLVEKRSTSTCGDRTIQIEDPPEHISGGSSSNDEDSDRKPKRAMLELKGKTMVDRFQEALHAASLNSQGTLIAAHRTSVIGLFGRLQHVMQTEKERDADFLKKLQSGSGLDDDARCIDVKILSRCLDGKLTVCCCSFSKYTESLQWPESTQTMRENEGKHVTVIFNSRLCNDIELEVGNLIRIHSPWKKVTAIGGDKSSVILSAYFSQISM